MESGSFQLVPLVHISTSSVDMHIRLESDYLIGLSSGLDVWCLGVSALTGHHQRARIEIASSQLSTLLKSVTDRLSGVWLSMVILRVELRGCAIYLLQPFHTHTLHMYSGC